MKKYVHLTKRKDSKKVLWPYFEAFHKYYGQVESEYDVETKSLDNSTITSQIDDLQTENNEDKLQYLVDNFMCICKFCSKLCDDLIFVEKSGNYLVDKIKYLFYREVSIIFWHIL